MCDDNSKTRTQVEADPPQLLPEGREGYQQASQFYKGELGQPSVYQGERFAQPTGTQRGAISQAQQTMGGPGGPGYRQGAESEMGSTLAGDWFQSGGKGSEAVSGLAAPIFERFENETMPGIRDTSQAATRGMGGSRRTVANLNAVQELGQNIGKGAVAPIFEGERGRMTEQAIRGSQGLASQDIARTNALSQMGETERQLNELPINAQREAYEEGLARRAESAGSLASMAGMGPGGSTTSYMPSPMRMFLGSSKA